MPRLDTPMTFQDDIDPNPVAPIKLRATNGGKTYYVKISMDKSRAASFLRNLWAFVGGSCVPNDDEDALGEWTDRGRCVRTTYCKYDKTVCVRTHAWSPESDREPLDRKVIMFLRMEGLTV